MKINIGRQMTASDFEDFLEQGAIIEVVKDHYIVGWKPMGELEAAYDDAPCFYNPDFFMEDACPWRLYAGRASLTGVELREFLGEPSAPEMRRWQEPSVDDFALQFELIQRKFRDDQLQKAVPVVFAVSPGTVRKQERRWMLRTALEHSDNRYVYGFWSEERGLLGVTPEYLVQLDGTKLTTMALAGTSKQVEGFLDDPKERHEHQLVVKDIMARTQRLGEIKTQDMRVLSVGSLHHLYTPIEVTLKKKTNLQVLCEGLHPTPALGVFPRESGYHWLKELGGSYRRQYFGAPFGMQVNSRVAMALVAIRNIQWDSQEAWICSGCGVVQQSQLDKEWQELFFKRQAVRETLGI